jgi:hypothetical protein
MLRENIGAWQARKKPEEKAQNAKAPNFKKIPAPMARRYFLRLGRLAFGVLRQECPAGNQMASTPLIP